MTRAPASGVADRTAQRLRVSTDTSDAAAADSTNIMTLPQPLSRPTSLLERSVRPTNLPAVVRRDRPATSRSAPVLHAERGSRQLSLPFFFAPADPR